MNAEEALSILAELSHAGIDVSLVISDWMMPGMKGDEFLIHAHKLYPNIKSIMVTGHADHEAIERVKNFFMIVMIKLFINCFELQRVKNTQSLLSLQHLV